MAARPMTKDSASSAFIITCCLLEQDGEGFAEVRGCG